ncbi:hypothetical protein FB565_008557 [Actinoplanes lutulentus]|nr:DUF2975 domain-containing protein [Actinoplanes lutulentus]MBB2948771.1 hypothetical protein [Actinoplanes lutulentus]
MRASLRRPDWLDELHGLLAIAVALTGIGSVVTTVGILAGQAVDVEVSSAGALINLPAGTTVDSGLHLHVEEPTGAQRAWELLATLPSVLLLTLALVLLWRLVGRARRGDPFTGGIVSRFRVLGLVLVVGGPAVWAIEFVGNFALSATVAPDGTYAPLSFAVPGAWLLSGFVMFAFGEIVRRGQVLRAELDEVV